MMVDRQGVVYDGDKLVYVIAKARAAKGNLVGGVVGTIMSNLAMEKACLAHNIPFKRAKVGDRYVLELLKEEGWQVGGEASGHILCLDKHNTGDGTISALQVFAALNILQKDLASAVDWHSYPQTMINVRVAKNQAWGKVAAPVIKEVETELGENGRVVVRPSGTEPVVRVMVEATSTSTTERLAKKIAQAIEQSTHS